MNAYNIYISVITKQTYPPIPEIKHGNPSNNKQKRKAPRLISVEHLSDNNTNNKASFSNFIVHISILFCEFRLMYECIFKCIN